MQKNAKSYFFSLKFWFFFSVSKFDKDILDKYVKIERRLNTINAVASIPVGLYYVISPTLENIYTYFYYGYFAKGLAIPAKYILSFSNS